ncbi:MAG: hypothetical protein ACREPT_07100 [Rudaea sp.]
MTAFVPSLLMAQEIVINGKDFESGAGDAKLAEIARQAAASGQTIVVSTPPYWQEKAIAKLRAGSSTVRLKTSDAFFENVLVRVVAAEPAAKPAAEPAPKAAEARTPRPAAEARPVAKPVFARAPAEAAAEPATIPPHVAPEPTSAAHSAPRTVAKVEATPTSAAPAIAAPTLPTPAAAAASASTNRQQAGPNLAEARQQLGSQLGLGNSIDGTIKVDHLQKGDQIFVHGPARAVVRRAGAHVQLFWLEGALNLERTEISKSGAGRYRVDEQIRKVADPTLRAMHSEPNMFLAVVPAARSSLRTDMERHFNNAKEIADRLRPDQLQYDDLFYIYRKYAVVFRRTDAGFDRYWLEGEVDLNQAGVVRDGDAYRVVSDRL